MTSCSNMLNNVSFLVSYLFVLCSFSGKIKVLISLKKLTWCAWFVPTCHGHTFSSHVREYPTLGYIQFIMRPLCFYQAPSRKSMIKRNMSKWRNLYFINLWWTYMHSYLSSRSENRPYLTMPGSICVYVRTSSRPASISR